MRRRKPSVHSLRFVWLLLLSLSATADAQVVVLYPLELRGQVVLGSGGVGRAIDDLSVVARARNFNVAPVNLTIVRDDTSTAEPHDASFAGVIQREILGALAQYKLGSGGSSGVFVQYQRSKAYWGVSSFTAPAAPTPAVRHDLLWDQLCSLRVTVEPALPTQVPDGVFVHLVDDVEVARQAQVRSMFAATGDPSETSGFIRVTSSGRAALLVELLWPVGVPFEISGFITVDGVLQSFDGSAVIEAASCSAKSVVFRAELPEPTGEDPVEDPTSLQNAVDVSARLRREAADVGANRGATALSYTFGSHEPIAATEHGAAARLVLAPNPMPISAALRWPDGRQGSFTFPRSTATGVWSPLIPQQAPPGPLKGLYRDGALLADPGEIEQMSAFAELAYHEVELDFGACSASPADLDFGYAQAAGSASGPGEAFTREDGSIGMSLTGLTGASASAMFQPGTRIVELPLIPGPWRELSYDLTFRRPSAPGSAVDPIDADLSFSFTQGALEFEVLAGRGSIARSVRRLPLGAITVTLLAINGDGSFRPLASPRLQVGSTAYALADLTTGRFTARARGTSALRVDHRVTLLAPESTLELNASADVPLNADGSGPLARATFQPLTNLRIPPPNPDGSCARLCAEVVSGQVFVDDGAPPRLELDPPPASTFASELDLTGRIVDGSPVASLAVGGRLVALGGSLEDSTRRFTTRVPLAAGVNTIELLATDLCGQITRRTITITRLLGNRPPLPVDPGLQVVTAGDPLRVRFSAIDPDGDVLTFGLVSFAPAGRELASLQAATGELRWLTSDSDLGDHVISFRAGDGRAWASQSFTARVVRRPQPPGFLFVGDRSTLFGSALEFTVREGEPLSFALVTRGEGPLALDVKQTGGGPLPEGARFDRDTARLAWTPGFDQAGTYTLSFVARDAAGLEASVDVRIHVLETNRPPRIEGVATITVREGESIEVPVFAADPDDDAPLRYILRRESPGAQPAWPPSAALELHGDHPVLTWSTGFEDAGSWRAVVDVFDPSNAADSMEILIDVTNVNRPPRITPVPPQHTMAAAGGFDVEVSDPDADAVTCAARELPPETIFDARARRVSWPDGLWTEGRFRAVVACTDGEAEVELVVPVTSELFDLDGGCTCGVAGPGALAWLGLLARSRRRRR